ncbi:Carbohydrate kinase PfkB [Cynara cardunculus var. scolymus]|nr:Carbohydrate kinase PfkB [Cynara cardunculus var. scolymus]
MLAAIF